VLTDLLWHLLWVLLVLADAAGAVYGVIVLTRRAARRAR
jgi:hypothetical protein